MIDVMYFEITLLYSPVGFSAKFQVFLQTRIETPGSLKYMHASYPPNPATLGQDILRQSGLQPVRDSRSNSTTMIQYAGKVDPGYTSAFPAYSS